MADSFRNSLARLEQALAGALETVSAIGTPAEIDEFVRLLIKKKIVTEMLLDKIDTLAASGYFRQPGPTTAIISANPLCHWDQLMTPANNGTNAEWETTEE